MSTQSLFKIRTFLACATLIAIAGQGCPGSDTAVNPPPGSSGGTPPPSSGSSGGSAPGITLIASTGYLSPQTWGISSTAYIAAGTQLYFATGGTNFGFIGNTPNGLPISQVKPISGSLTAYATAGPTLYFVEETGLTQVDTLPSGNISQLAANYDGSAYVTEGTALYETQGDQFVSLGQMENGASISALIPFGTSESLYVAAGSTLYQVTYSAGSSGSNGAANYGISFAGTTSDGSSISQVALADAATGAAYISAGSKLYYTNGYGAPFAPVSVPQTLGLIVDIETIPGTVNAYVAATTTTSSGASMAVYSSNQGQSLTTVDSVSLSNILPSATGVAINAEGNAYVASGTGLYLTQGTTAPSVGTAGGNIVKIQYVSSNGAELVYAAAGNTLYTYTPSNAGAGLVAAGTTSANPTPLSSVTNVNPPAQTQQCSGTPGTSGYSCWINIPDGVYMTADYNSVLTMVGGMGTFVPYDCGPPAILFSNAVTASTAGLFQVNSTQTYICDSSGGPPGSYGSSGGSSGGTQCYATFSFTGDLLSNGSIQLKVGSSLNSTYSNYLLFFQSSDPSWSTPNPGGGCPVAGAGTGGRG